MKGVRPIAFSTYLENEGLATYWFFNIFGKWRACDLLTRPTVTNTTVGFTKVLHLVFYLHFSNSTCVWVSFSPAPENPRQHGRKIGFPRGLCHQNGRCYYCCCYYYCYCLLCCCVVVCVLLCLCLLYFLCAWLWFGGVLVLVLCFGWWLFCFVCLFTCFFICDGLYLFVCCLFLVCIYDFAVFVPLEKK